MSRSAPRARRRLPASRELPGAGRRHARAEAAAARTVDQHRSARLARASVSASLAGNRWSTGKIAAPASQASAATSSQAGPGLEPNGDEVAALEGWEG